MKAMVIGISPEYNYPNDIRKWVKDNTYYASNHGGSLIVRAIIKEFGADYIIDFSDISSLKNKYDTCILGLATHAHRNRDISKYVDFLLKLDIKIIIVSLGIEDYLKNPTEVYKFHPSVNKLLQIASSSSSWIGVRGPYTASIVQQNGFKNVVPVGCPTMYWNLSPEFRINTKQQYTNPLVVYHKSIAQYHYSLIKDLPLLGQDYLDEIIFTNNQEHDIHAINQERRSYDQIENKENILQQVATKGVFTRNFDEWFSTISKHDFVFGPRLHGCIGALIQGIPSVFLCRDLRVKEIVEMYKLPHFTYDELKHLTITDIYNRAQYEPFLQTYKYRYKNYLSFIKENNLESRLSDIEQVSFNYQTSDIQTMNYLYNIQINTLKQYTPEYMKEMRQEKRKIVILKLKRLIKKLLFIK